MDKTSWTAVGLGILIGVFLSLKKGKGGSDEKHKNYCGVDHWTYLGPNKPCHGKRLQRNIG